MPWTPAQHRLFEAAAHNPRIAKAKGIPMQKAASMASEGIKPPAPPPQQSTPGKVARPVSPQALAKALMSQQ